MKPPAAVVLSAVVAAAVCGLTASAMPRVAFTMYDEGVYYLQAVRLANGEVPYRDFFSPQPPGVLLIGAASERVGAGVVGVRAVSWACGLVLLALTYLLTRRLLGSGLMGTTSPLGFDGGEVGVAATPGEGAGRQQPRPPHPPRGAATSPPQSRGRGGFKCSASAVAAALVAAGMVFAYQSVQGATNMPAACLELAACLSALGGRFTAAGLVLAGATAFRLPAVVAVPGLLLLIRLTHGPGLRRVAKFLAAFAVGCAAIHLSLAAAVPGYFDNVVGFQAQRTPVAWADRAGQIAEFLTEPAAVCGLPAAVWFAWCGSGAVRGVAVHSLVTAAAVSAAGNALSVMYYLPVLPPLAACAGTAAANFPRMLVVLPLAAAALSGPVAARAILAQTAPNDEHAACVAELRKQPGATVLTSDGRIAVLAGKRTAPGYYATDPNALYLVSPARFHEWFDEALAAADVVVVTPQLLHWMSPENAERVRACGKPVLFDTTATREWFGQ